MSQIRELTEKIEAAGLGPVTSVNVITAGDLDVIRVELDATSPHKARTLLRWLDFISVQDMVAGKFHTSDRQVRLNVRGQFPSGGPVIVVAPFHEQSESEQTALIRAGVERQRPQDLLEQLAGIETRGGDR